MRKNKDFWINKQKHYTVIHLDRKNGLCVDDCGVLFDYLSNPGTPKEIRITRFIFWKDLKNTHLSMNY